MSDAIDEVIECIDNKVRVATEVAQLLTRYIQRVQQQNKFGR